MYSIAKHVYQDDGEIVTESIALDKEGLQGLRAKIMSILIDKLPVKKKFNHRTNTKKPKQTKLF